METRNIPSQPQAKKKANYLLPLIFTAALIAAFLLSFSIGRYGVPVKQVVRILLSRIANIEQTWTREMETVVINIRLPRILLACLVGCSLSAAGTAYQGVFNNPMASPDILGAANGAAFGAALAILLGGNKAVVTGTAFVASLLSVLVVFLLARFATGIKTVNLILGGMVVGSLFTAGTSYIKLVADPGDQLPAITYWLMGSLSGARLKELGVIAIPMVIGLVPLLLVRWRINVLTLGEDEARALGIHTTRLRFVVILSATLLTAASIATSGMIGWVGLVIPHLCRKLTGGDFRRLLPSSCVLGALFLLIVDNVSRSLLAVEIPIGILTAFIGAPFFIHLILRREKTL